MRPWDVLPGDDQFDVSLPIVVEEPVAKIGDVREVPADRVLELLLGERSLRFRHIIDGQRGLADLDGAGRNSSAIDEYALYLRSTAQAIGDSIGDRLGIGEPRAGRQLDREQRTRGIRGRQKSRRQQTRACQRQKQQAEPMTMVGNRCRTDQFRRRCSRA